MPSGDRVRIDVPSRTSVPYRTYEGPYWILVDPYRLSVPYSFGDHQIVPYYPYPYEDPCDVLIYLIVDRAFWDPYY